MDDIDFSNNRASLLRTFHSFELLKALDSVLVDRSLPLLYHRYQAGRGAGDIALHTFGKPSSKNYKSSVLKLSEYSLICFAEFVMGKKISYFFQCVFQKDEKIVFIHFLLLISITVD